MVRQRTSIALCAVLGFACGAPDDGEAPPVSDLAATLECDAVEIEDACACEPSCERLGDGCFASGRVVGLERSGDDCALRLGPEGTGVWTQRIDGCLDGPTRWLDLHVDADTPPDTTVLVSHRAAEGVISPVGLPWSSDAQAIADLRAEQGRFLEVRVELRSSPTGESPLLRSISVGVVCAAE
jgi:hypothetical protein